MHSTVIASRPLPWLFFMLAISWLVPPSWSNAQFEDEDEELPEFLPGLIAEYQVGSTSHSTIAPDLTWDGKTEGLDARLPSGDTIHIVWRGLLRTQDNGQFRLHAFGNGQISIRIADQEILNHSADHKSWLSSQPIELRFGRHPIEVEYTGSPLEGRLSLFWEGPSYPLEPIAARYLWHESQSTFEDPFRSGEQLGRALRCAACHTFPRTESKDVEPILSAPDLTHLQDNLRPSWLVSHLMASEVEPQQSARNMPLFGLDRNSAMAIAAALMEYSASSPQPASLQEQLRRLEKKRKKKDPPIRTLPDPKIGERSFASLGCLACHQVDDLGESQEEPKGRYGGGNLSHISTKRTRNFLQRWLENPAAVNSHHRMPVFELSLNERLDLIGYLSSLGAEQSRNDTRATGDISRGLGLLTSHRCGACHQLPDQMAASEVMRIPVTAESNWESGCLTHPRARAAIPGYGLSKEQKLALKSYYTSRHRHLIVDGQQLLHENNCTACHARDLAPGISPHLPAVAKQIPDLAPRLAALSPPAITGVGDKLRTPALQAAIERSGPNLRPWLDVKMPNFQLTDSQLTRLSDFFMTHDRIPAHAPSPQRGSDEVESSNVDTAGATQDATTANLLAGARLVTAQGFGCQSCHQIGEFEAPQVDLKARGTNLHLLGNRLRPEWFRRWVRNPARIVPRMEMPAIQIPATGILDEDLPRQLDALWDALNDPNFVPPRPNPVRTVRTHNQPDAQEQAQVVTCVIETARRNYLRPLAIGLPNRHNVLFDLEKGELAGWWLGDTASQYTRGKTWFWELGATFLNNSDHTASTGSDSAEHDSVLQKLVVRDREGQMWEPARDGQFAVAWDGLEHIPAGVIWRGRIFMKSENRNRYVPIEYTVTADGDSVLIQTAMTLPKGDSIELAVDSAWATQPTAQGILSSLSTKGETLGSILVSGSHVQPLLRQGKVIVAHPEAGHDEDAPTESRLQVLRWTTRLTSTLPADHLPILDLEIPGVRKSLDCLPGYEVTRLPISPTEMPVSFAWSADGRFYFGSLKGRVFELLDTDQDGLPESMQCISDNFPTPYGLAVTETGDLDVLTKFALVRLTQPSDRLGMWKSTNVADGWGYTADYHDWAVGLEQDSDGSYFMVLPCQQDERSAAAAHLRGHALRLVPNLDSPDQNRAYRPETLSAGLRFPMGLALSPDGDLFATDNQGNYNPFNELNHLRQGKRYGFINRLENRDGFAPEFESPAINLPHPWTRSVNGICWLNDPNKQDAEGSCFGPFEGHLLGCEMNGRSLIRMSLQLVDGQYQGAAYDFSIPGLDPSETFEGPIVAEVSPAGDIYIGNLHDSGWGGGQNTGSIVRLRPKGPLPLGISEVLATPSGLKIRFTQPVDPKRAADVGSYQLRSYRRVSTPAYGGDDQDESVENIESIRVASDRTSVDLTLAKLRAGCVYEVNIGPIGESGENSELFPNRAHYTMRAVPTKEGQTRR